MNTANDQLSTPPAQVFPTRLARSNDAVRRNLFGGEPVGPSGDDSASVQGQNAPDGVIRPNMISRPHAVMNNVHDATWFVAFTDVPPSP